MTEQIVQNNYRIIEKLNEYKKSLLSMTNVSDIILLKSKIMGYLYDYPILEREFKRKCYNYVKLSQQAKYIDFQKNINNLVQTKLPDTIFMQTQGFQKYNIPSLFYYPAFVEMRGIVEVGSGIWGFYYKNYRRSIYKYFKLTRFSKEEIQAFEDYNFYFMTLPGLDQTFIAKGQPEEFNLKYLCSIISAVLEYFEQYILNFESVVNYTGNGTLPHLSLTTKLHEIYNLMDKKSTYASLAEALHDDSKGHRTTINNVKRLAEALGIESKPLKNIKAYKKEHAC